MSKFYVNTVEGCLSLLLSAQYVQHPTQAHPSLHHVAVEGTGQGLPHSGDQSDLAFWHNAESGCVNEQNLRRKGIAFYCRFRDDFSYGVEQGHEVLSLFDEICAATTYFKIKLEEVGQRVLVMVMWVLGVIVPALVVWAAP